MTARRISCCNPRCGRTARANPDAGPDAEICCQKCWKLLPRSLVKRYRELRRRERKVRRAVESRLYRHPPESRAQLDRVRGRINRALDANWQAIHDFFRPVDKPDGLAAFLEEVGL